MKREDSYMRHRPLLLATNTYHYLDGQQPQNCQLNANAVGGNELKAKQYCRVAAAVSSAEEHSIMQCAKQHVARLICDLPPGG